MNTALAICAGIAATGIVYQVMRARLRAAQADVEHEKKTKTILKKEEARLLSIRVEMARDFLDLKADRDQLAQALKETQEDLKISDKAYEILQKQSDKLNEQIKLTKVTRDPKTGRMVSAKKK